MSRVMSANDKRWEREEDAHTLARAEEINADKKRLRNARKEAVKMAKEKEKQAQAMNKVAKVSTPVPKKKEKQKKNYIME